MAEAPGTAPKRCVAIINPAGANGKSKKLWQKLVGGVSSQLTANGFALEEQFTTAEPGSAARLASQAAASQAEVVLAVGGDGTIHEVVSGLVQQQQQQQQQRSETALAVLPLGTGSDYARTFGWRLNDAAAACQRILSGEQQLTDVSVFRQAGGPLSSTPAAAAADVPASASAADASAAAAGAAAAAADTAADAAPLGGECRYMVNVASCAVGALSAAKAGELKQLGTLCYQLGGALTLLKWKGCTIQVCMDDSQEWQTLERLTTLVVGQGRFWGGGMQILPDADPTDGLMDVVALQGLGLWDFISKGHLLRTGQHIHVKGVSVLGKCHRLQVRAAEAGAALAWECDGEPQGHFEAVEISVLPGVLRLLSGKPAAK